MRRGHGELSYYHNVDTCPLTKFEGEPNLHHDADDDAVIRLESTATAALVIIVIVSAAQIRGSRDTFRHDLCTRNLLKGTPTTATTFLVGFSSHMGHPGRGRGGGVENPGLPGQL